MENLENQEKYLPIGTVVILKDAKKRIMITGFCCIDESDTSQFFFTTSGISEDLRAHVHQNFCQPGSFEPRMSGDKDFFSSVKLSHAIASIIHCAM